MGDRIRLTLANPFLVGIHSFALLLTGVAIGARWGHSPRVAMWMIVLGAGLMVAHDMLAYSIFFLVTTAWACEQVGSAKLQTNTENTVAKAESLRNPNAGERARKRRRN